MSDLTHGMNLQDVESLGYFLKGKGATLEELVADLDRQVRKPDWQGADADRFRNDWWPKHKGYLRSAAKDIEGLGQSALNNARDQRAASGEQAGFPTSCSVPPGSMDPRTPGELDNDRLRAYLDSGQDLKFIADAHKLRASELDEIVKIMKNGGIIAGKDLPVVGTILDLALGGGQIANNANQYGYGDGRTMWAEVDMSVSLLLTPIPGGGMAWALGTKAGEYLAVGLDGILQATTGDTYAGHFINNQLNERAGGDFQSLSLEEQGRITTELAQRYDGWSGFRNFIVDSLDL